MNTRRVLPDSSLDCRVIGRIRIPRPCAYVENKPVPTKSLLNFPVNIVKLNHTVDVGIATLKIDVDINERSVAFDQSTECLGVSFAKGDRI